MTNPFDNENGRFVVLVNDEGQHSLWPVFADIPPGWTAVTAEGSRAQSLEYVERTWTDMRPRSLAKAMEEGSDSGKRPGTSQH
jgi:MbtH protein